LAAYNRSYIRELKKRRVKHPAYRHCQAFLQELYDDSVDSGDEFEHFGAYVITAPTRSGKSTAIADFMLKFSNDTCRTPFGDQLTIPVLHMRVRTASTLKQFVADLCLLLGIITSLKSTSRAELTFKVLNGLKAAQTKLVIIDEINIVHDSKGPYETAHIRNFIKELVDESGIPIVFVGTPESKSFFKSDGQTDGRVEEYLEVPPFMAPTNIDSPMFKTTKKYIEFLQEDCQLTLASNIDLLEFSQRVYLATGGRMGGIKKVFVDCAERTLKAGKTTVTLYDFASSFNNRKVAFKLPASGNPFKISDSDLPGLMKKYPKPLELRV
jgi:hypothetical protein